MTQPLRLDWTRNEQMLLIHGHTWPKGLLLVQLYLSSPDHGIWRMVTHCALSLTSSEQCYFLRCGAKVWNGFKYFGVLSSPATFLPSVSGPPISPQVPVEETLNQVKTQNSEIYNSLWSIFQKYDFCEFECGSELLPGPPITIVASVPHTVGSYKQFNSTWWYV